MQTKTLTLGLVAAVGVAVGCLAMTRPTPGDNDARLAKLQVLSPLSPWNVPITGRPVHPNSAAFLATMGLTRGLHPDFGTVYNGAPNGIPFALVPGTQAMVPITFAAYGDESDPGPYPVPADAPIEGGAASTGDRHVLVIDYDHEKLFEMYRAFPIMTGNVVTGWRCDSGAVWDLKGRKMRKAGWTSADAAGLPIFPGLARYDECVVRGEIKHALRFTANLTQRGYILPATHWASSSTDPARPPMGLRLRLKSTINAATYPASVRPIIACLKKYGMILADNGSDLFISGAPDPRWSDDDLSTLSRIKGGDFEVVDTGAIVTH